METQTTLIVGQLLTVKTHVSWQLQIVIFSYSGSSMFLILHVCGFEGLGMGLGMIGADPEILHGWWLPY